jgi:electron transfer flavoprotein alpha subunit
MRLAYFESCASMTTLLVAEHDNRLLNAVTARALTAARQMDQEVHLLVAGESCRPVAKLGSALAGISQVIAADAPELSHHLAEPLTTLIASIAGGYDRVVAAATTFGKDFMPRLAARLDVMQVSDITRVLDPHTFERPIYAGNAIETVRSSDPKMVITVRTSAFRPTELGGERAPIFVTTMPTMDEPKSSFVSADLSHSERPELTAASIVISGGRAFQSAENFNKYLVPIADKLRAAIGASRAAVDAGYAPNDLQVGQTGKIVAPDLYIACGISGAIQHLAGMKDARVIVAINRDPDAPIFKIADYGLVGDVFQILPELEKAL